MIYGKLPTTILFLFSFAILAIGGYQCATKIVPERTDIPIKNGPGIPNSNGGWSSNPGGSGSPLYEPGYGQDSGGNGSGSLPSDPENRCARKQYRSLSERYGEMAVFKFDSSSIEDYRLGIRQNFDIQCARMYLDMSRLSGASRAYKGMLVISFEDGRSIKLQRYKSGFTAGENKYNKWVNSVSGATWEPNSNGRVNKEFYAIFEDQDAAVILQLKDIRIRDVQDGKIAYLGAGDAYYKMFRTWTGDNNDVCYSKGNYARYAKAPPSRNGRCWLLGTGPFSCRPNGVLSPGARVTDINIRGSLKCYSKLGSFYNLDIEEAFNVGSAFNLH